MASYCIELALDVVLVNILVCCFAEIASSASLAVASLIAPIGYGGDLRPYYTMYDGDHKEYQRLHDSTKLPGCILGTTNPFMVKVCAQINLT